MKLVSFSLQNFRSIRKAEKINLESFTVLIGPNNEGKSNILLGLVAGMRLLEMHALPLPARTASELGRVLFMRANREKVYVHERDMPVALQVSASAKTIFDFEFDLSLSEVASFKQSVGSNLNGRLPVRLTVDADSVTFEVKKRGPGAKTLTSKRRPIARFVGQKINMHNIPSIRTANNAVKLVGRMVEDELETLEDSPEYRAAVDRIAALQQPVLNELAGVLEGSLKRFLPELKTVGISVTDRFSALRRDCQVVVDDGTATELQYKGDGIQSLAAMSLLHHLSQQQAAGRGLMLAIEEPEAHLHPRAVHALREVIKDIAKTQQVVITTHSPLLVNRVSVSSNVIVNASQARSAKAVSEVREVLGVRVSDNLISAKLVLLVEGIEDCEAVRAVLRARSQIISSALDQALLVVEGISGVGNLSFRVAQYKNQLCGVHVFADNDSAGLAAVRRACDEGVLETAEYHLATAAGMRESEIEDLYNVAIYADRISKEYSVPFPTSAFNKRKKKWSERTKNVFQASGKMWDESTLRELKRLVAAQVIDKSGAAIAPESDSVMVALVAALEGVLAQT